MVGDLQNVDSLTKATSKTFKDPTLCATDAAQDLTRRTGYFGWSGDSERRCKHIHQLTSCCGSFSNQRRNEAQQQISRDKKPSLFWLQAGDTERSAQTFLNDVMLRLSWQLQREG
jgi:hypothetical protein